MLTSLFWPTPMSQPCSLERPWNCPRRDEPMSEATKCGDRHRYPVVGETTPQIESAKTQGRSFAVGASAS